MTLSRLLALGSSLDRLISLQRSKSERRKTVKRNSKKTEKVTVGKIITDRITAELAKGEIPWKKPWTGVLEGAYNLETGRPYAFINQIMLNHPTDGYATFDAIKRLGARLKKDSKAEVVFSWWATRYEEKDSEGNVIVDDEGNVETSLRFSSKYTRVFWEGDIDWNIYETIPYSVYKKLSDEDKKNVIVSEWEEADENGTVFKVREYKRIVGEIKRPSRKKLNITAPIDSAESLMKYYSEREGMKIYSEEPSNKAYYAPIEDYVRIPMLKQFKHAEQFYATAFHEMTHSTGHVSRLNRLGSAPHVHFGDTDYSKEELVAEMGSAMLCSELGIETPMTFKNSAAYIQGWLKALNDDQNMFFSACTKAEKAVKFILGVEEENEGAE